MARVVESGVFFLFDVFRGRSGDNPLTHVKRLEIPSDRLSVELTLTTRLRAGDHFGEIALLHDVPRTATVRALTDVELLALDRDEFIGAVTGHPESAEAAHAVVAARLASLRPSVGSV